MRDINSFFQQPRQDLWHYTSIAALMGIEQYRTLWAGHAFYLNDSAEILEAAETLRDVISDRLNPSSEGHQNFLGRLSDWTLEFTNDGHSHAFARIPNVFIFSLSESQSLLSQWRAYTPHGKGVSLCISPETLTHIADNASFKIAKCLYKKAEHLEVLNLLLDKLLETFDQRFQVISAPLSIQQNQSVISEFVSEIVQVLAIIKNHVFEEEQEWRLISPAFGHDIPHGIEVQFREGASMLVPYVEIKLPERLAVFKSVTLGPSEHPKLSFHALAMFLFKDVDRPLAQSILHGRIPYREWK